MSHLNFKFFYDLNLKSALFGFLALVENDEKSYATPDRRTVCRQGWRVKFDAEKRV